MGDFGEYWRDHKAHQQKEKERFTYCPKCDKREFHKHQRRCFNRACAYEERK